MDLISTPFNRAKLEISPNRPFLKRVVLLLPLLFLLLFSSCNMGRWHLEGKIVINSQGEGDVTFQMYPADEDARKSYKHVLPEIIRTHPDARVEEVRRGREKGVLIHKKVSPDSPDKNYRLTKENNRWRFSYMNLFHENMELQKLELEMPGAITDSNANYTFGSYARWERPFRDRNFYAESSIMSFNYILILYAVLIITALIGAFFLFKKIYSTISKREAKKREEEDFRY